MVWYLMTKMNNNMWTIEIYYPEISDVKVDWSLPLCLNYVCPGWHNYSGLDVDPWNYWIKQSYRTSKSSKIIKQQQWSQSFRALQVAICKDVQNLAPSDSWFCFLAIDVFSLWFTNIIYTHGNWNKYVRALTKTRK